MLKKNLQIRALFLALACLSACSLWAQRVTRSSATIYERADASSRVLAVVPAGSSVAVHKAKAGGWSFVTVGGKTGYMKGSLIVFRSSAPKPTKPTTGTAAKAEAKTTPAPKASPSAPVATAPSAARSTASSKVLTGEEIYSRYSDAVFMIVTADSDENIFQGSGFFIAPGGVAVTNYHVFKDMELALIKLPGNEDDIYDVGEIIAADQERDYVVFRVRYNNSVYVPLSSRSLKCGERVYAIGSPKGLENTISDGLVSHIYDNIIQTTVNIDHGSSGGVLLNQFGEAVGITSGTLDGTSSANLNYAWSVDVFRHVLNGGVRTNSIKRKTVF